MSAAADLEAETFLRTVVERERRRRAWPAESASAQLVDERGASKRASALRFFESAAERHGLDSNIPERALGLFDRAVSSPAQGEILLMPPSLTTRMAVLACLRVAWKAGNDRRVTGLMSYTNFVEPPVRASPPRPPRRRRRRRRQSPSAPPLTGALLVPLPSPLLAQQHGGIGFDMARNLHAAQLTSMEFAVLGAAEWHTTTTTSAEVAKTLLVLFQACLAAAAAASASTSASSAASPSASSATGGSAVDIKYIAAATESFVRPLLLAMPSAVPSSKALAAVRCALAMNYCGR